MGVLTEFIMPAQVARDASLETPTPGASAAQQRSCKVQEVAEAAHQSRSVGLVSCFSSPLIGLLLLLVVVVVVPQLRSTSVLPTVQHSIYR